MSIGGLVGVCFVQIILAATLNAAIARLLNANVIVIKGSALPRKQLNFTHHKLDSPGSTVFFGCGVGNVAVPIFVRVDFVCAVAGHRAPTVEIEIGMLAVVEEQQHQAPSSPLHTHHTHLTIFFQKPRSDLL